LTPRRPPARESVSPRSSALDLKHRAAFRVPAAATPEGEPGYRTQRSANAPGALPNRCAIPGLSSAASCRARQPSHSKLASGSEGHPWPNRALLALVSWPSTAPSQGSDTD